MLPQKSIKGDWPTFVQGIEKKEPSKRARMTNINRISFILKRAQELSNATNEAMVAIKREMALFNASTNPFGPQSEGLTSHIRFILEWSFDYNLSSIQILDVLLSTLSPHLNPGVDQVTSDMFHLHVPLTIVVKYLLSLDIAETKMRAFQELYESYQPENKGRELSNMKAALDQIQERVLMLMNEVLVKNLDSGIKARLLAKLFWNKVINIYPELKDSLMFSKDSSIDSIRSEIEVFISNSPTPSSKSNGTIDIEKVHRNGPVKTTIPTLDPRMIFNPNLDIPSLTDGQEFVEEEYYYKDDDDEKNPSYDSFEKKISPTLEEQIPLKSRSGTSPSMIQDPLELTKETLKIKMTTTGAETHDQSTLPMMTPNRTTFAYYEELYNDFVDESYDLLKDHFPSTVSEVGQN